MGKITCIFFLKLNNQSTFPKRRAVMHSNNEISTRISGFSTDDTRLWQDVFFLNSQVNNELSSNAAAVP